MYLQEVIVVMNIYVVGSILLWWPFSLSEITVSPLRFPLNLPFEGASSHDLYRREWISKPQCKWYSNVKSFADVVPSGAKNTYLWLQGCLTTKGLSDHWGQRSQEVAVALLAFLLSLSSLGVIFQEWVKAFLEGVLTHSSVCCKSTSQEMGKGKSALSWPRPALSVLSPPHSPTLSFFWSDWLG